MSRTLQLAFAGLFLGSTLIAGCSSNEEKSQEEVQEVKKEAKIKAAKLVEFEPVTELEYQWSQDVGSGQDKRYTRIAPAAFQGYVYAADKRGRVYAFAKDSGKRAWKRNLEVDISAAVTAAHGLVLLGTYDGEVYALDAKTGTLSWKAQVSSEILSPPQTNGDIVAVQTIDGKLFAFDAKSGEKRWSSDQTVPVLTLRATASPVLTSTQVIAAFDNGLLMSFSASDGSSGWQVRVSQPKGRTELERIADIDSTPIIVGGVVYAAAYQGSIAGVGRGKGRVLWKKDISTFNHLAEYGGKIIATTEDSHVIAFNASSGAVEWENDQLKYRGVGSPTIVGSHVAAIDDDGYLHLLSAIDGEFTFRFQPPATSFEPPFSVLDRRYARLRNRSFSGEFRSPLASSGNFLYILSNKGTLSAYKIKK